MTASPAENPTPEATATTLTATPAPSVPAATEAAAPAVSNAAAATDAATATPVTDAAPTVTATPAPATDTVAAAPLNAPTHTDTIVSVTAPHHAQNGGDFMGYFHAHHSFEGLDMATWIRWGVIILIWLAFAFWHQHQNKAFHSYIRDKHKRTPISDRLSQLAYNRSFEVLALFFFFVAAVIFYDTRINKDAQDVQEARTAVADMQQVQVAYTDQLAEKDKQLQEAARLSGMDETQQQALDALKPKYENLFINYYYLKKCNLNNRQDFHIMNSALVYELNRLNAPASVRQNILTAAKGSYQELYANQSCNDEQVAIMQENVRSYLETVVENLPDE